MSELKTKFVAKINAYLDGEIELKQHKAFLITGFIDYQGEECQWLWRGVTGHAAMYNFGTCSEDTLKDAYRWMLRRDAGDVGDVADPMFDQQWVAIMFRKEGPPWPFQVINHDEHQRQAMQDFLGFREF